MRRTTSPRCEPNATTTTGTPSKEHDSRTLLHILTFFFHVRDRSKRSTYAGFESQADRRPSDDGTKAGVLSHEFGQTGLRGRARALALFQRRRLPRPTGITRRRYGLGLTRFRETEFQRNGVWERENATTTLTDTDFAETGFMNCIAIVARATKHPRV